jgi:uncharacterized protein
VAPNIEVPGEELAALCRRHHIRKLALFGSILHGDFRPESDMDVLVEFEPGYNPGFAFFDIERDLEAIFGHRVDLNTPGFLSPHFRDQVVAEARDVYVAA